MQVLLTFRTCIRTIFDGLPHQVVVVLYLLRLLDSVLFRIEGIDGSGNLS